MQSPKNSPENQRSKLPLDVLIHMETRHLDQQPLLVLCELENVLVVLGGGSGPSPSSAASLWEMRLPSSTERPSSPQCRCHAATRLIHPMVCISSRDCRCSGPTFLSANAARNFFGCCYSLTLFKKIAAFKRRVLVCCDAVNPFPPFTFSGNHLVRQ